MCQEDQSSDPAGEQHCYWGTVASLLILQQICSLYSIYQLQVYTACKAKKKSNTVDRLLSQQIWPNSMLTIFFLKNRNGTWDMLIVTTEWKYIPNRSVRKLTGPNDPPKQLKNLSLPQFLQADWLIQFTYSNYIGSQGSVGILNFDTEVDQYSYKLLTNWSSSNGSVPT